MLEPAREEHRPPALAVIAAEFEIVALACHAGDDVADAGPRVEPAVAKAQLGLKRFKVGEAEGGAEEAGAGVAQGTDPLDVGACFVNRTWCRPLPRKKTSSLP